MIDQHKNDAVYHEKAIAQNKVKITRLPIKTEKNSQIQQFFSTTVTSSLDPREVCGPETDHHEAD